jgi:hypothetical protein
VVLDLLWPQPDATTDAAGWKRTIAAIKKDLKRIDQLLADPKVDSFAADDEPLAEEQKRRMTAMGRRRNRSGAWQVRQFTQCSTFPTMPDPPGRWQHPWLRVSRPVRVILQTRWSSDVWPAAKAALGWELA